MMLNSYVPNAYRRYAIAGLVIAMVTPLAAIAYKMLFGASMAHAGFELLASPFGLASIVAPLGITALIAGLGYRHDRLARQIRSERAATKHLRRAAYHDSLTGLRNRHALSEDVELLISRRSSQSVPVALLLFDLDRFKYINDTMGHAAGDLVLKTLADRLRSYCNHNQKVYRLGGDEFVLLWEGAPGAESISNYCNGLAAFVFRPVESALGWIDTAGSMGSAVLDSGVTTLSELLKRADIALYHAKEKPGSSHSLFTHDMEGIHQQRQQMEGEMRKGISSGAFHLDYLPVLRASTLSVSGFSVRVRWSRPQENDLEQKEFLPMAEESGLILPLGKWMLEKALHDAKGWRCKADVTLPVSAVQLRDPAFADSVIRALTEAGLEPSRLVLDVEHNATKREGGIVLTNLERLRENGVKIGVSELAASIAGLSMVRDFPVDRVCLDLARIRSLAGQQRLNQMLTLFLQLATTVETPVILTGVDSEDDFKSACAAGAEQVQGAYVGSRLCGLQISQYFATAYADMQCNAPAVDLRKCG
ncbi:MAG: putative bifunctional diguanylate cyclase/phosphodiesterase [Hoeflea sp.]|uniref:putative bifunctional diguanylate cyclase/phosphodiesterase n=1 Tax=Hoeflea sp. TaxID=1940281 RepID=UPI003EF14E7D